MKRIPLYVLVIITLALIVLPALGNAASIPRKRTSVIAQGFDPQYLWPNASTASTNLNCGAAITESLVWTDPRTGKIEPLLAESWSQINDTTLELKLRKGVSFTNGEPMNADAVKFSLELLMDKKTTPAYSRYATPLKSIEKVDEHTVRIHTKAPYPGLMLTLYRAFVVPPKYWGEVGKAGFNQKPVGTGPFKFTEWKKDDRLVMDKNEGFWGDPPKGIDRIIWKPVPDDTARAAGLETGEYDLIANMSVNSVPRVEADPNIQVIAAASYRIYTARLSSLERHPGPLHDVRVRQAFNYAIDKDSIIENLFFGKAKPLQGQLLFEGQLGFNPNLSAYPYDPEKAKKLLNEANYPWDTKIQFKFPSGRYAQDREVAEAVAGMLAKIGVKIEMIVLEPGEYLRQLRARELGAMSFGGSAPPPDPHFQISQHRSDWRYSYYQNPELDKLIDAGMVEMDEKKRAAIYHKATQLMYTEAPVIFIYQGADFYGATQRLKNWKPTGDQRIFFYGITLQD